MSARPPVKVNLPKFVELTIGDKKQTLPWNTFIEIAQCCHDFETNQFPKETKHGDTQVKVMA